MKKRIISLILVLATAFLTLTGCAYNYAKDDMLKYVTNFDADAFLKALQNLVIEDSDKLSFGTDETKRQEKVDESIASDVYSSVTDKNALLYAGTPLKYDYVKYLYYITDAAGHVYSGDKMNWSSTSGMQVGLAGLENDAAFPTLDVSNALMAGDIKDYVIDSSKTHLVQNKDIITLTYKLTYTNDRGETVKEAVNNKYWTVDSAKAFDAKLLGERINELYNGDGVLSFQKDLVYKYSAVVVNGDELKGTTLTNGQEITISYVKTHEDGGLVTDETVKDVKVTLPAAGAENPDPFLNALVGKTVKDDSTVEGIVEVPFTVTYNYEDLKVNSVLYKNRKVLEGDTIFVTYKKHEIDYGKTTDDAVLVEGEENNPVDKQVVVTSGDELLKNFLGKNQGKQTDISIPVMGNAVYTFEGFTHPNPGTALQAGDKVTFGYTVSVDGVVKKTVEAAEFELNESNELHKKLIGLTEAPATVTIEEIVKTEVYKSVEFYTLNWSLHEGYTVYVSYDMWYDISADDTTKPVDNSGITTDKETGDWIKKVTYEKITLDKTNPFHAYLIGQSIDATSISNSDKLDGIYFNDQFTNVPVTFKNIKLHYAVAEPTNAGGIEVKYTPYTEAPEAGKEHKLTDIYGAKHDIDQVELTYHIFPVYYLDVQDMTAENIAEKFSSALASKNSSDSTKFAFPTLNNEAFKNGDVTLGDLVDDPDVAYNEKDDATAQDKYDLVALVSLKTAKDKIVEEKLKALTTAQNKLYEEEIKSSPTQATLTTLRENVDKAAKEYDTALTAANAAKTKLDAKIKLIVEATDGTTAAADAIMADYKQYKYDRLEATYESNLRILIEKEVYSLVYGKDSTIEFKSLPKRAVKDAYKALMNEYKYTFYEKSHDSGAKDDKGNAIQISYYKEYNGKFNDFLVAESKTLVGTQADDLEHFEQLVEDKAKETVKEIMVIYLLAEVIGEDVQLTKDEKKNIKNYNEQMKALYAQFGSSYNVSLDGEMHAAQFDKIFEYIVELDPVMKDGEEVKRNDGSVKYQYANGQLVFKNIGYTISSGN